MQRKSQSPSSKVGQTSAGVKKTTAAGLSTMRRGQTQVLLPAASRELWHRSDNEEQQYKRLLCPVLTGQAP